MPLTVSLNSAYIVLTIRQKPFRLDAPDAQIVIDPDNSSTAGRPIKRSVHWSYHAAYDKAFDLGPLSDAQAVLEEIAQTLPAPPAGAQSLIAQWDSLKDQLNSIPVLSNAANNVVATIAGTSVKITDLGLDLELTGTGAVGSRDWRGNGAFKIGLAFTPSSTQPIRLFQLGIQAFGAVLNVKLEGIRVNNGQLTWS